MIALAILLIACPAIMFAIYKVGTGTLDPLAPSTVGETLPLVPKTPPLSTVARKVLDEYNSLPIESRPFDNIEDILASLDAVTAHRGSARDHHFNDNYENILHGGYSSPRYTAFKFSWTARSVVDAGRYLKICDHKDCPYATYVSLHKEIQGVKKALADKAKALVESENAHNVSMAAELVKALREEAGIQTKVSQEIRSGT